SPEAALVMTPAGRILIAACLLVLSPALSVAADAIEVMADPRTVRLHGPGARYSLLITGQTADGRLVDRTHAARYQSLDPRIARVTPAGVIHAVTDGTTTVTVQVEGRTRNVAVTVEGSTTPRRFHFENDIEPVLSRFGCNSSGCHGKAEGQNGFKLSVFGFDPAPDFAALTQEAPRRRGFPPPPAPSLILRQAAGQGARARGL